MNAIKWAILASNGTIKQKAISILIKDPKI